MMIRLVDVDPGYGNHDELSTPTELVCSVQPVWSAGQLISRVLPETTDVIFVGVVLTGLAPLKTLMVPSIASLLVQT